MQVIMVFWILWPHSILSAVVILLVRKLTGDSKQQIQAEPELSGGMVVWTATGISKSWAISVCARSLDIRIGYCSWHGTYRRPLHYLLLVTGGGFTFYQLLLVKVKLLPADTDKAMTLWYLTFAENLDVSKAFVIILAYSGMLFERKYWCTVISTDTLVTKKLLSQIVINYGCCRKSETTVD